MRRRRLTFARWIEEQPLYFSVSHVINVAVAEMCITRIGLLVGLGLARNKERSGGGKASVSQASVGAL